MRRIVLDFIPAFLGVLIALLLSNWKENKKENEFIQKSIISIYDDNRTNLENIEAQIEHLNHQLDTVQFYLEENKLNIIGLIRKNGGLQTKTIRQTGWDILKNSNLVSKIDYELLSLLEQMNDNINYQDKLLENTANIIYNNLESTQEKDKLRIYVIFRDLMNNSLAYQYSSEQLDSILNADYEKILEREH